ncbi:MAG: single-stranded DNA-binding protein [Hominimerdicola sp.]
MINSVVLMGRLTATPELRHTASDKSVVSFTIAVDSGYKDGQTDFIDCEAWEKIAEFIANYFDKGSLIAVVGQIKTNNFTDKDGNKRKSTKVKVLNASFTGERKNNEHSETPKTIQNYLVDDDIEEIPDDAELPF